MTPAEMGWVAGILDGEGCIGLYRNSVRGVPKNHALRVSVGNCDGRIIERLQELCGGRVRVAKRQANPRWRTQILWDVSGYEALKLLEIMEPFLIGKAAEARLALQVVMVGRHRRRTPEQVQFNENLRQQLRVFKGHRQTRGEEAV